MFTGEEEGFSISEFIWTKSQTENNTRLVFPYAMDGTNAISVNGELADAYRMIDGRDINASSAEYPYPTEEKAWQPISNLHRKPCWEPPSQDSTWILKWHRWITTVRCVIMLR